MYVPDQQRQEVEAQLTNKLPEAFKLRVAGRDGYKTIGIYNVDGGVVNGTKVAMVDENARPIETRIIASNLDEKIQMVGGQKTQPISSVLGRSEEGFIVNDKNGDQWHITKNQYDGTFSGTCVKQGMDPVQLSLFLSSRL